MIRLFAIGFAPLARVGLEALCASAEDLQLVGLSDDPRAARDRLAWSDCDVVLVDARLGEPDAVDFGGAVRRVASPDAQPDGAAGWGAPADLLAAIRGAAGREAPGDPTTATRPALSLREEEVVARLAAGLPPSAVARELGIARSTLSTLLRRAKDKVGVESNAELVARFGPR